MVSVQSVKHVLNAAHEFIQHAVHFDFLSCGRHLADDAQHLFAAKAHVAEVGDHVLERHRSGCLHRARRRRRRRRRLDRSVRGVRRRIGWRFRSRLLEWRRRRTVPVGRTVRWRRAVSVRRTVRWRRTAMRWSALVWWRVTMRRRSTLVRRRSTLVRRRPTLVRRRPTLVRRRSTLVRRRTVSASRRRTVASRRRSPIPPSRRRRRRALLVVLLVIIIVRPRAVVFLRRLEPFRRRRQRLDAFAQRRHLSRQRFQRRAHLREPLARDRLQRPHARRDIFDLLVRARFHPLRRRLGASRVRARAARGARSAPTARTDRVARGRFRRRRGRPSRASTSARARADSVARNALRQTTNYKDERERRYKKSFNRTLNRRWCSR